MSKYLLNKFLYTIDRDAELMERYRDDPVETVAWWEEEMANKILNCTDDERSTWLAFDDEERRAEERAQKLTDEHVAKIDEILKRKEEEIMEV